MVWVRVDDHLYSHPKIRRAWSEDRASIGLYLLALSYSGDQLTDGVIDDPFVDQWLPAKRDRERATAALAGALLWERNSQSWVIHDFLAFNESRQQVLDRRRRDTARKQKSEGKP